MKFTYVAAIDGRDPDSDVDVGTSHGRLTGRPRSRIDHACVTSHRRIYERMFEEDLPYALILEDDVIVADDFAKFTKTDWIPEGVDIVKLETMTRYVEIYKNRWNDKIGRNIADLKSLHLGAAGYLITQDAARRVWEATSVPYDQIDHILFNSITWKELDLNVVQVDPAPTVQGTYHGASAELEWAQSAIQADRDKRGITVEVENHRKVGNLGPGLSFKKIVRPKTAIHMYRWARCALNGGAYKRIDFG